MSEETRAAEYRRQQAARAAHQKRLENRAGSPSAAKRVRDAWKPWTDPQPVVVEHECSERVNA